MIPEEALQNYLDRTTAGLVIVQSDPYRAAPNLDGALDADFLLTHTHSEEDLIREALILAASERAVLVTADEHLRIRLHRAAPDAAFFDLKGNIKTVHSHPDHWVIGTHLHGHCFEESRPVVYYCDSYDRRQGFWIRRVDAPRENWQDQSGKWRRNVSERAIGSSLFQINEICPGRPQSRWGFVHKITPEFVGRFELRWDFRVSDPIAEEA